MAGTLRLKTVVFLGSARDITPPWGGCSRLGDRVLKYTLQVLQDAGRAPKVGDTAIEHEVVTYDPLEVFGAEGALADSGAEVSLFLSLSLSPSLFLSLSRWHLLPFAANLRLSACTPATNSTRKC
jgi:hypothetical protein